MFYILYLLAHLNVVTSCSYGYYLLLFSSHDFHYIEVPIGGVREGIEGAEGTTIQRPMTPASYVAENGLIGCQWEEKPLVLQRPDSLSVEECQGREGKRGESWGETYRRRGRQRG